MLYSSEISQTKYNNCVFILRNGFTLHVSGDNLTNHQEYFVIPNGRIRLIQLPLGVFVLVSQFCLLGVDEFNICGSEHHAL